MLKFFRYFISSFFIVVFIFGVINFKVFIGLPKIYSNSLSGKNSVEKSLNALKGNNFSEAVFWADKAESNFLSAADHLNSLGAIFL